MPAPQSVIDLVQRFESQLAVYKSGRYNETELRRDFLDPFFEALGWDVRNTANASEKYRDVIHEQSVEVGGQAKSADYLFKIGADAIFFVEAKKPAINIETDPAPAFQLKSYAWSRKLPFSILSDFEQMAFYECNARPVYTDLPSLGRVALYNFRDYVPKWDEIAARISRAAVTGGAFETYVQGVKGKRGTTDVDDAFLAEMERWRDLLAHNLALRNPALSQRELNFAVQATIDRIIFLRICEDRGIEPDETLKNATDGIDVYGDLLELFRRADRKYNSGLFHFEGEKGRPGYPDALTPSLKIDDKVLKDILANLYLPRSPYRFNYFSADILGQVYERFLGKVIRLTPGHLAKVEDKPEVRKAGGVYYTPTYIVDYIVRNTVGELLKDKTPDSLRNTPLRVLDPACGSGSFLLGAYQYLLDWYQDWYTRNDPARHARGAHPAVIQNLSGWQLTLEKKKEILTNHIFGVDIDPQAVEVTKLSLLLKVVENPGQLSLMEERLLPDLGANIQCGNSLIGPDFYEGQQPALFDSEEQYRVNAFDWHAAFPQVFRDGGFDAVIGNPPYGAFVSDLESDYYLRKFITFKTTRDIYTCFIEKCISILNSDGKFSYIVPSAWVSGPNYETLRVVVLSREILNIVLLPFDVFSDAYIDTLVFVISNKRPSNTHAVKTYSYPKKEKISSMNLDESYNLIHQRKWTENEGQKFILDPSASNLLSRLQETNTRTLNDVAVMKRGVLFDKSLLVDNKKSESYFPYFEGDVYRYVVDFRSSHWIAFDGRLKERPKEFVWFENERILLRRLVNRQQRLMASLTNGTFITNKNLYSLLSNKPSELYCVLGILNSKLLSYLYLKQVTQAVKDDFPQVTIKDILALPFPSEEPLAKNITYLDDLAKRMLALHKSLAVARLPDEKERLQRQIQSTDNQIDALVYQLYGLTPEEITIVEAA